MFETGERVPYKQHDDDIVKKLKTSRDCFVWGTVVSSGKKTTAVCRDCRGDVVFIDTLKLLRNVATIRDTDDGDVE